MFGFEWGFLFVYFSWVDLVGGFCLFFNTLFHSDIIRGKLFPTNKHKNICFHLSADILCTVLSFFKCLCSHAEMGRSVHIDFLCQYCLSCDTFQC